MSFSSIGFESLLNGAKATRLPGNVSWRKPKFSARRVADMARTMRLDDAQITQLRTTMGRRCVKKKKKKEDLKTQSHKALITFILFHIFFFSFSSPVKTRAYRLVGKGHKHERNRIARLELIEVHIYLFIYLLFFHFSFLIFISLSQSRLKEIPKIEQQHKQQVERDRIRMSKKYKGLNLVYTPSILPADRADDSLVKRLVMPDPVQLTPKLLRIAQNKHLTALPPHLQAELDRLRAARDAAAAAKAAEAAAKN
jgi:hypothetical protein